MVTIPFPNESRDCIVNASLSGFTPLHERKVLCWLSRRSRGNILEIGCNTGVTTRDLAHMNPDKIVYAVDYVGDDDTMCTGQKAEKPLADRMCVFARELPNVVPTCCKSADFNYQMFAHRQPIGFIFIDGDHSYLGVKVDTEKAIDYLHSDRIAGRRFIVWHDYNEGGNQPGQHPVWCKVKTYLDTEIAPLYPLVRIAGTRLVYLQLEA